ncbi:39S ribosomal protein L21, mitochondrial [Fopius arisanus]|uniref:Large ribosomal subunit protein bL21m n=1 Tax=Fopius arisanus TaxID=64838 RepID=A0A9R1THJ6_9HYME|nr:PREDICTED: 39S ribosomal protein L21, mitochondrial [Fopius arisanus]
MAGIPRLSRLFATINCGSKKIFSGAVTNLSTPDRTRQLLTPLAAGYKTYLPWMPWPQTVPHAEPEVTPEQEKLIDNVTQTINNQLESKDTSRLFAVVQVTGKQFKITESDLIIIQGYWPPQPGDKLKLEKVLLVGGTDFTLVGRPILNRELASVDATVIEKTFSHTKTFFKMRKRKQYRRIHFRRMQHTIVRINSININRAIDKKPEVEGLDRIF